MKSATFKIEGLRCEACARKVQTLMTAEPGVQTASVSFDSGQARILYDPQAMAEDRLVGVIEKAGYRVPAPSA